MLRFIKRFIIALVSLILLIVLSVTLFLNFAPAFGDQPSDASLEKIKNSKYHDGEVFVNLVPTDVSTADPESEASMSDFLYEFFYPPADKNPSQPLPSKKFDPSKFVDGTFSWFGHSTILMRVNGTTILTDPVFFNASPIPGTAEAFDMEYSPTLEDLPEVDVVLISHDHYDHLDYQTIKRIKDRGIQFFVPLGVKAHLVSWDVEESRITEMEWYEETTYKGINFVMTPSRHFSGRGLTDRYSTLWCSWVIQSDSSNIFFSGDSGYFEEFKNIGNKYGPFDIAFMENGAYNIAWSQIHFMPGENVQAVIDLKAKHMFAIHWGKFDLARHQWDEPIIKADSISSARTVSLVTPLVGQVFDLNDPPYNKWWRALR